MLERCPHCQVTLRQTTIGGRAYCSSCGEPIEKTDPKTSARSMDFGRRPSVPAAVSIKTASARPASSLHQRARPTRGAVIDLRSAPKRIAAPAKPATPTRLVPPAPAHRLTHARAIPKSSHISRFGTPPQANSVPGRPVEEKTVTPSTLPPHAQTKHEALARLAAPKPASSRSRRGTRYAATAAAVAVMAAYIWLNNYPKLELKSASQHAGFALNLPTYLPATYSLSGPIASSNGLATLTFASPGAKQPLRITQHRTDWDSSSLLNNVVTQQSSTYSSVQGQGLTIYLWGDNQAAWVNHGVWYGIEGASNLSRAQVLKIAYSL